MRILIALLILACSPAHLFAQTSRILDRLPFEVVVDIAWRGQEFQIRKVLSCDMRKRLYPKERISGPDPSQNLELREVWDQSVYRISYVLPSKEVIIFQLPSVCQPLRKSLNPLPDGFLPIAYWVDNSDAPTSGDEIVYYQYFKANSRRRFDLLKFQVVEAGQLANKIDNDQRLVLLFQSAAVKKDAYFVGASVVAIPKAIWVQYSGLAAELSKFTESGMLDRPLVEKTAKVLLEFCQAGSLGIGRADKCPVGPFDDRPFVISASPISGDQWRLDYDDVGVRHYIRYIDADKLDRTGCNASFVICNLYKGSYRIEVGGKTYEIPHSGGKLIFDAERQILLSPRFGIVSSTFVNAEAPGK